ncbi:MAG: diacylglycerol kinase family lipid kinase [Meiothermus sp.]|nr:diacylglycerol kinase family lipid kinase [Meiothermus sp.]
MKTTLIVNPNAGGTGEGTIQRLEDSLGALGYVCEHRETHSAKDLEEALSDPGELVVAAGGDGTLRAVATRLAGRGVPLALVPLGTANNIARSLGIVGPPESWLEGLRAPRRVPFDVGRVRGSWGTDLFLEGAGAGLFALGLSNYDPEIGKDVLRALGAALQTLREYVPRPFLVWLDGEPVAEPLTMLEVMNTPSIGPRLRFAPQADPGDGLLDVVLVSAEHNLGFASQLAGLISGQFTELPNVAHRRCRRVALEWDGSPFHLDDELRQADAPERLEIEVWPAALEIWLPAQAQASQDERPTPTPA